MSGRLKSRTAALRRVVSMLTEIDGLIRYKRSTLPEIRKELGRQSGYASLISNSEGELRREEYAVLCELLSKLGTTDAEGQAALIELCRQRFTELAAQSAEEQRTKCRLYDVLGFMAGAFIAVMIV